eukprot:992772-Prorocentrum_minimum.AAC.2
MPQVVRGKVPKQPSSFAIDPFNTRYEGFNCREISVAKPFQTEEARNVFHVDRYYQTKFRGVCWTRSIDARGMRLHGVGENDTSSLLIYCEIVRPPPPEAVYEPPPVEPAPIKWVPEGEEGEPAGGEGEGEGEGAEGTAEENGEEGESGEKPEGEEVAGEEAEPKAEGEAVAEEAAAPEGEAPVEGGEEAAPEEEVRGKESQNDTRSHPRTQKITMFSMRSLEPIVLDERRQQF